MTKVPTWISRMSAVALATASMSVFAVEGGKPDFIMHKASVNLKISSQGTDGIDKDTLKTKDLINILMGRSTDAKNEKDEKLGMVTGCNIDRGAVALVVYDKKADEIKAGSGEIIVEIEEGVVEFDKNGALKKSDLIGYAGDFDEGFEEGFVDVTAQVKYGKIGSGCAKDGDVKDYWNKDSVCAKNFKSKSVNGLEFIGSEIVMSGKISAGSCQFAADFAFPGEKAIMSIFKDNDLDGDLVDPGVGVEAEIEYQITVKNVGDVDLTGVTVEDFSVIGGALACGNAGDFDGFLDVNDSVFCVGDVNVTHDEFLAICNTDPDVGLIGPGHLRNIAVADSNQSSSFATSNVIDFDCHPDPDAGDGVMSINKEASQGGASIGDTIDYTITVRNLGSTTISSVSVNDLVGGTDVVICSDRILAPFDAGNGGADTTVCTTDLLVTEELFAASCAADAGAIRNVAITQGIEEAGGGNVDTDKFATDEIVLLDCVNIDPV